MVTLCCAIVGDSGSAFPIDIDTSRLVGHLKKEIKTEQPNSLKNVDASELQLFLAKTSDGQWLTDEAPAALELYEGKTPPEILTMMCGEKIIATKTLQNWFFDKNKMSPPSSQQIHVLVVVPEEDTAIEQERKRRKTTKASDEWVAAIQDEQVTVLPRTCEDLREHLQRALRVKIPINDDYYQLISVNDSTNTYIRTFDKLFERKPAGVESVHIVGNFVRPPGFPLDPHPKTRIIFCGIPSL